MKRGLLVLLFTMALVAEAGADGIPVYSIGSLTFHGPAPADAVPAYDIGTLTFHGEAAALAPAYSIGTLAFHGPAIVAAPAFTVGTLTFRGSAASTKKPRKPAPSTLAPAQPPPPLVDLGKIFGLPPAAATTAPPAPSAPATGQSPTLKKYLLLKHSQTPPLNSDLH
jgi:hypothetical protein